MARKQTPHHDWGSHSRGSYQDSSWGARIFDFAFLPLNRIVGTIATVTCKLKSLPWGSNAWMMICSGWRRKLWTTSPHITTNEYHMTSWCGNIPTAETPTGWSRRWTRAQLAYYFPKDGTCTNPQSACLDIPLLHPATSCYQFRISLIKSTKQGWHLSEPTCNTRQNRRRTVVESEAFKNQRD